MVLVLRDVFMCMLVKEVHSKTVMMKLLGRIYVWKEEGKTAPLDGRHRQAGGRGKCNVLVTWSPAFNTPFWYLPK